jgi:AraC-like DNA-binding protein
MASSNTIGWNSEGLSTQWYVVHNKLQLGIQRGLPIQKSHLTEKQGEVIELGFNLGGRICCKFQKDSASLLEFQDNPGQVTIGFYPGHAGVIEYPKEQPVCCLGLFFPVDVFKTFFDMLLSDFMKKNSPTVHSGLMHTPVGPITANMQMALHQIMRCPFEGKTKCLFLESKALELISYVRAFVERPTSSDRHSSKMKLTADDHAKMWDAKHILDENLDSPPSIVDLAKQVGVNEFKLKNGFRQVHGMTPYKYLTEQRLEVARQLLWERQMNVTEAAFAVGYSSLSHFAKIFHEKYGVFPHKYFSGSDHCFHTTWGETFSPKN